MSGSQWWWIRLICDPGRSLRTRGLQPMFALRGKVGWQQYYVTNHSTDGDRAGCLALVEAAFGKNCRCRHDGATFGAVFGAGAAGNSIFLSGLNAVDPGAGKIICGFGICRTGWRADWTDRGILAGFQRWADTGAKLPVTGPHPHHDGRCRWRDSRCVQTGAVFKRLGDLPRYTFGRRGFFSGTSPVSTLVEASVLLPPDDILIESGQRPIRL